MQPNDRYFARMLAAIARLCDAGRWYDAARLEERGAAWYDRQVAPMSAVLYGWLCVGDRYWLADGSGPFARVVATEPTEEQAYTIVYAR